MWQLHIWTDKGMIPYVGNRISKASVFVVDKFYPLEKYELQMNSKYTDKYWQTLRHHIKIM